MQRILNMAFALVLGAMPAMADDITMTAGKILKLKDKPGTGSDQALVKFIKEPALIPAPPSPLCPAVTTVQLRSDSGNVETQLDCNNWSATGSGWVYRDVTGSSGGVQKIILTTKITGGKLLLKLRGDNYGAVALAGGVDYVEARLIIDATSYCGRFESPPGLFKKNDPDKVVAKGPSIQCSPFASPTPTETNTVAIPDTPTDTPTTTLTATPTVTPTSTATRTPTFTVPPGSTATDTPTPTPSLTPGPPEAFRIDTVSLRDPHVFANLGACSDVTELANTLLTGLLTTDGDDADMYLDLSLLAIFRSLHQPPHAGGSVEIATANCEPPVGMEVCSPDGETPQSATYQNQTAGVCLEPLPGTSGPGNMGSYTPPITTPSASCFATTPVTLTFPFGVFTVPLQDVSAGATYVGDPANQFINGLLRGFLSEADADMIIIPPSVPLVGGQPVSRLLPGGTGSCAPHTAKDIGPGSQPGWDFHLNFTARRVTWTGP